MKKPQCYFISDFHFNHKNIINFERTQFTTIDEHNSFLIQKCKEWAAKIPAGSTLYNLGDWGDTDFLWVNDIFTAKDIKLVFLLGNHDHQKDIPLFEKYFDEVYSYPFFISNKLVISHIPVAVYDDTVNIHGHLHNSKMQKNNYINVSLAVNNYNLFAEQNLNSVFSKLPEYNRKFLYEPFAAQYRFINNNNKDVVCDKNGNIDISASRVMKMINKDGRF